MAQACSRQTREVHFCSHSPSIRFSVAAATTPRLLMLGVLMARSENMGGATTSGLRPRADEHHDPEDDGGVEVLLEAQSAAGE